MVQIIGSHTLTPAPFADEVHDMGDFVNAHPEVLGDDVQIISRELQHGTDGPNKQISARMDEQIVDMHNRLLCILIWL